MFGLASWGLGFSKMQLFQAFPLIQCVFPPSHLPGHNFFWSNSSGQLPMPGSHVTGTPMALCPHSTQIITFRNPGMNSICSLSGNPVLPGLSWQLGGTTCTQESTAGEPSTAQLWPAVVSCGVSSYLMCHSSWSTHSNFSATKTLPQAQQTGLMPMWCLHFKCSQPLRTAGLCGQLWLPVFAALPASTTASLLGIKASGSCDNSSPQLGFPVSTSSALLAHGTKATAALPQVVPPFPSLIRRLSTVTKSSITCC